MYKFRLLLFFFFIAFLAVIIKLFYLQVYRPKLSLDDIYHQDKKINPQRGKIFDRNGQPLAINIQNYLLYLEPKKITNEDKLIRSLNKILNIDEATLESRLDKSKDWVIVQKDLTRKQKEQIEKIGLDGVGFEEGFKRYYPEASLAAHILGFVGKDYWGEDIGYFGIEGFYNKDLKGLPGVLKSERDLFGKPIFVGTQEKIDPEDGNDLYLTIDSSVQAIAKKKLQAALESYDAKEGCVLIADPYTMRILAAVCLPDFSIEEYYKFDETYFKNPIVSDVYEPGSIFKPLVVAAALEEKAIKEDSIYNEKGPVKIGEYSIKTWNDKYEGKINITRILEKSSNVGMVYIGEKLGNKKLYSYLEKFGFGQLTGIDLQGEVASYLKSYNQWYPIDFATVTFGQGIAVTPIQILRAFAAIVNGGNLMKPLVVEKVVFNTKEKTIQPETVRKVISKNTSETVKKMLVSAVENGEVRWAKPDGFTMGGKTGTAQIAIAGHYDVSKTNVSFIGFAPADKPKFIALVTLNEPKSSPWGSETAAPLFFEIAKELLIYYNIAPDQ